MKLESILYLSPGNLPSPMAHSLQIAKMSQSLAKEFTNFTLVTRGDILSFLSGMDSAFQEWYALEDRFQLMRLPLQINVEYPLPDQYYPPRAYYKVALLYTCFKSPSLIYTRSPEFVKLLLKMGLPVLWEWHEPIEKNSAYHQFLKSSHLLGVVTTLPQIAESYMNCGLSEDKICVVPNGVDLKTFSPYLERSIARHYLGLPQDETIIVYSGHLYEYKGIPVILDLAQQLPSCQFILVGGWETDVQRVRSQCQEKQLNNIKFIGHISQNKLKYYLYAGDILLLPTSQYWELANATCPLKLFDYMAVQRPIVASALPTIQTILTDQKNALLAQPDQADSFKEAITQLLAQPQLAKQLTQRAFQDVQQFTWEQRAKQVVDFATQQLAPVSNPWGQLTQNFFKYFRKII
ncbi:glycosyltransferase family 4 protein [Spirulina sp. CS-785/01]|uniref:glycosyltransferase family 4 protein n=1 Tax=Spirulina sp. CS-785/01 TaxID=3021716 RepID=UPI00232DE812|nr:glycosyltransferase family 4 protein [Spirulina sp. CS-785/01]MDB9314589.1 glycosyltransferase family 4 protein [Spirulina sp. CS-785/01]